MNFAASLIAGGNISATADESGTVDTDNLTVNALVTVQSTGGNVTLQAGETWSSRGFIDDTGGQPTITIDAGTTVSATKPVQLNLATGADGTFSVRGLFSGGWRLRATSPGGGKLHAEIPAVEAGETGIRVDLAEKR